MRPQLVETVGNSDSREDTPATNEGFTPAAIPLSMTKLPKNVLNSFHQILTNVDE
jgi:hypothetical protein